MGNLYAVITGVSTPVALSAATAKTVIEVLTTSACDARLVEGSVSFDAAAAAAGIKVELVKGAATGTGSAFTPLKMNAEAQNLAAVFTAKTNDTVEPASLTVVRAWYVPNTAGLFWQLPLGRELYVPPSTLLGLRITSAAAVNCGAELLLEQG